MLLQEHLFAKKNFHVLACLCAYFFQHLSPLAYYYTFLAVAFHNNLRPHANDIFLILKIRNYYLCTIGYLFIVIKENLFTNNFRGNKSLRLIRQLVFVKICRVLRQVVNNQLKYF